MNVENEISPQQPPATEPPPSPPPPKSASGKTVGLVIAAVLLALIVGGKAGDGVHAISGALGGLFGGGDGAHAAGTYYTCGMHPWVLQPSPGACPICGMDLVPLDPAKFTGEVTIDPIVAQNIGVRVADVERASLESGIRTVGTIAYDETRVRDINTKMGGWIEKLHVDQQGAFVREGAPLFTIYSPELFSAQEEYLLALRSGAGQELISAARTKLEYLDVSPAEIAAIAQRGTPQKNLLVRSPHTGFVIAKHANEGMKIEPGMLTYRIADLSKVWVKVTLYEYQLPSVQAGQAARMTLQGVPGKTFSGKVAYVYPYLDEKSRQAEVRLEFDNREGTLKPGMYATVVIEGADGEERTLVPRAAVIDTGARQVAFVSKGGGRFEPREVRMGAETLDGKVEVLDGLDAGEKVVVSGQFLLDSEAKMREALAKMIKGEPAAQEEAPSPARVAGAAEIQAIPEEAAAALGKALDAYLAIGDALAADRIEGVGAAAESLAQSLAALGQTQLPGKPHFWHEHRELADAREKAQALAKAGDLGAARTAFHGLSEAAAQLLRALGVPAAYGKDVQAVHCPMFEGGATWLQVAGPVRNPYYGAAMLTCADDKTALPVAGANG